MNSVKLIAAAAMIAIAAMLVPGTNPVLAMMVGTPTCTSNDCATQDSDCQLEYSGEATTNRFTCCVPDGSGRYTAFLYVEKKQRKGYYCPVPDYSTVRDCTSRYPDNAPGGRPASCNVTTGP